MCVCVSQPSLGPAESAGGHSQSPNCMTQRHSEAHHISETTRGRFDSSVSPSATQGLTIKYNKRTEINKPGSLHTSVHYWNAKFAFGRFFSCSFNGSKGFALQPKRAWWGQDIDHAHSDMSMERENTRIERVLASWPSEAEGQTWKVLRSEESGQKSGLASEMWLVH